MDFSQQYEKITFSLYNRSVQATMKEGKGDFVVKKNNDLAHTKWMCKYYIVSILKYRLKVIDNQYKTDIRDISKQLRKAYMYFRKFSIKVMSILVEI